MRAPTDEDLVASFFDSDYGDLYREFGRNWELMDYIRDFLKPFAFFDGADPVEAEKAAQRIANVIRSRNARKAARTRKKRAEAAKEAGRKKELEEASPLLPGIK